MGRMAKVTIKNIDKVKKEVIKLFDEIRQNPKMLLEIGEKTIELTQAFNRAGSSPTKNLGQKRHPANSDAWEKRKKKLTKTNTPSEFYREGLSNVTFTGQLLESIEVNKINKQDASVEIQAKGTHEPYKNLAGKKSGKSIKNAKLVEYLKDKGRLIFGINKQITNNINRIVRRYMNLKLKEFNKK